jgi:hypothetical protein
MKRCFVISLCLVLGGCSDSVSPSEICNRLVQCIGKVAPMGAAAAVQSYGPSSPCWANSSTAATCTNACQGSYQQSYSDQCGCNQNSDCNQATCDPSTHQCVHPCDLSTGVDTCPSSLVCDPKASRCVAQKDCTQDTQCAGYKCSGGPISNGSTCGVNCAGAGTPSDVECATGFKCQPDFTCVQARSCTFGDDTPCGAFKCDFDNFCKASCNGTSDCATGSNCDPTTHLCQ